jgi:hypothetical protein
MTVMSYTIPVSFSVSVTVQATNRTAANKVAREWVEAVVRTVDASPFGNRIGGAVLERTRLEPS